MDWPEGWPAVKSRQVPPTTFGALVTNGLIDRHSLDPSRYHCTGLFSGGFCYYAFYRFMPCKHDRCHARHEPLQPLEVQLLADIGASAMLRRFWAKGLFVFDLLQAEVTRFWHES